MSTSTTMSSTTTTSPSNDIDPLYIETSRDLDESFRDMQPCFEGKESEQNWSQREKNILRLRRITKGNSPQDFIPVFLAGIKMLLDGILKTVNSLRTTVSTNGCHLVQEIAKAAGSGLDTMVEIILQNLVKLCANTKKITAANGDATVSAVVANVTYNARIAQHIWAACQDKNVQPRSYAAGWLKTIITKNRNHKHALEHGGSLDLIEKCLKAGLADRDPKVRENMRPTYWAFARSWSDRGEAILSSLDLKQQKLLIDHVSNPKRHKDAETLPTTAKAKPLPSARSTAAGPTRPTIKETIAAQKRAQLEARKAAERPRSAERSAEQPVSPLKSSSRPVTAMSKIGTLSSAPVRPVKQGRHAFVLAPRKPGGKRDSYAKLKVFEDPSGEKEKPTGKRDSYAKVKVLEDPSGEKEKPTGKRDSYAKVKVLEDPSGEKEKPTGKRDSYAKVKVFEDPSGEKEKPTGKRDSYAKVKVFEDPSGEKEKLTGKRDSYAKVKVFEDPSGEKEKPTGKRDSYAKVKVFEDPSGEKENPTIGLPPIMLSHPPLLAEEIESPRYHRKWINLENETRRLTDADRTENPYHMRRILDNAIDRIGAGTLEVHGFRKLQALIRSREDVWEDGVKFDELLQPLLENLESPNIYKGDGKQARSQDQIKTQVLMTIRLLQQHHPKYFTRYHSQALCSMIIARKHHEATSHIVCGLEETSEYIVAQCDPHPCIDAVLDLLETQIQEPNDGTYYTGLYVLAGLLHQVCSTSSGETAQSTSYVALLTPTQQIRLGHLAVRCFCDTNTDIRRAVIEFALELHDIVGGREGAATFWKLIKEATEEQLALLTYYLVRRERKVIM